MGENSKIAWTTHTFNPWMGCAKVSPGCAHCYAEAQAARWDWDCFGSKARWVTSKANWAKPRRWAADARKAGVRARVFCASLADVFEDRPELVEPRKRLEDLIWDTFADLDWLLLTKRAQNFGLLQRVILERCWVGVTVEDRQRAAERIPLLLEAPARLRFLSLEPLLEEVDLRNGRENRWSVPTRWRNEWTDPGEAFIPVDWVIVGGESGAHARPFELPWARSVMAQCRAAGVPVFVKQLGRYALGGPRDVEEVNAYREKREVRSGCPAGLWRLALEDREGREFEEWPEDLRVQELPK